MSFARSSKVVILPFCFVLICLGICSGTKLEDMGQVSFYLKSGRILKSEVLKEYPDTVRILSKGEEMVIRKDSIQFALDSSGVEIPIEINGAEPAKKTEENKKQPEPPKVEEKPPAPEIKPEPAPPVETPVKADSPADAAPSKVSDEETGSAAPAPEIKDVPVDGKTKVYIQMEDSKVYEGVILRQNKKYYYFADDATNKEQKIKKRDVVKIERAESEDAASSKLKIDFYMKDKTTVKGVIVEEKPAMFILDSGGKRVELQKKDITFALDEEGKDFKINIDPFLLKSLEEDEKRKKEESARRSRENEEKQSYQRKTKADQEQKQTDKEQNYQTGLRYFGQNNFKSAVSYFERSILSDPEFAEAYYRLAFSYYQIGEEELAWKNVEKAKILGMKQAETLINIMEKDKERKIKKQKLKTILFWIGLGASVILVSFAIVLLLLKRKEASFDEALNQAALAPGVGTNAPVSASLPSDAIQSAFESTKMTDRGFLPVDESAPSPIRPVPESPAAAAETNSAPMSQDMLAAKFDPERAERSYLKAAELCSRGNLMEAKAEYENAIQSNPRFDVAYVGVGYVLLSQGKFKEAIQQYLKSLDINPNQPEAHYSLGVAYYNLGDANQAKYEWKKALMINPNFKEAKDCLEALK